MRAMQAFDEAMVALENRFKFPDRTPQLINVSRVDEEYDAQFLWPFSRE